MSGRIVNARPKPGYMFDGRDIVPIRASMFRDGALTNLMSGRGTSVDRSSHNFWVHRHYSPQQIEAAYRSNWLHRKIVDIPAQDMTRAGRDWDAPDEDIERIEAEERRLGYWDAIRTALIYARLGGGAIFINLMDKAPDRPMPKVIRPEMVESLVPLYRTHITLGQMDDDLLSPSYGQPVDFRVNTQAQPSIHPSRLVIFKGQMAPSLYGASWEDQFWGDSVVQVVDDAVKNAMTASDGFAALIDEAKVDVFTMPGMYQTLAQPGGQETFMAALQAAATGKSIHRMLALGEGETWETRQLNWSGMPQVIQTYLSIVAGAADIPATRLLGKSPDGLNATGEHDERNYQQSISSKQEMDLRPALEKLDAVMLPSAGVTATDLSWAFSPLLTLTEQQQAEVENKEADTVTKLVNSGTVPESAMAKAVQNRLIESQRWPGLADAIEEAEAAGEGLPEDDPSAIVSVNAEGGDPASAGAGGDGSAARNRAVNDAATWLADATPRPLYVQRKLLNAADLAAWAKANGFTTTLPASDMHVTVLFSREPVDPMKMGHDWREDEKGQIVVRPGGPRVIERLGENAVVLRFACPDLDWRHREMIEAGGSHDYPEYQPHVTISYSVPENTDLDKIKPFDGKLIFGPEIFEALDLDWKNKISETR